MLLVVPHKKPIDKKRKVTQDTSLRELWEHSALQQMALPEPHALAALLQRSLPFQLDLTSEVAVEGKRLCQSNAPRIVCELLKERMNAILRATPLMPREISYMLYDLLLLLPTSSLMLHSPLRTAISHDRSACDHSSALHEPRVLFLHFSGRSNGMKTLVAIPFITREATRTFVGRHSLQRL